MSLFEELKRRHVFRVGIAYAIVGWLIIQVADIATESFAAPEWVMKVLFLAVLLGFAAALLLAWAFQLTPDGIRKDSEVDPNAPGRSRGRVLEYSIVALLLVAAGVYLYLDRDGPGETPTKSSVAEREKPDAATESRAGASIAVLPFVNMSPDPSQEYFSDGISEELLNVLASVDGLRVSSRTSSFAFKGVNRNIREIADVLGVAYIVEGSVRKADNKVRITAQLIDTVNDEHLWSDTYDRELADVFAIQDEISNAIVQALRRTLGLQVDEGAHSSTETRDLDAYDLYLRAKSVFQVLTVDNVRRGVELLKQVVEKDPGFTRAWWELAAWLSSLPTWDHSLDIEEHAVLARQAAQRALSIEPDNANAYVALALVDYELHKWDEWQANLEKALSLEPQLFSHNEHWAGSFSEGWLGLGYASRALEAADRGLRSKPDNPFLHLIKAMSLQALGRIDEARVEVEQAILLGYAGGASDQLWTYYDASMRQPIWSATVAMYQLDHDPELLPLLPHIKRVLFADPADRDYEARRFWQVAAELGFDRASLLADSPRWGKRLSSEVMAVLGEHETVAAEYWGNSPMFWMWEPELRPFRQSEAFKARVRESGMLAFWKENGWPDLCGPVGEEDFECR